MSRSWKLVTVALLVFLVALLSSTTVALRQNVVISTDKFVYQRTEDILVSVTVSGVEARRVIVAIEHSEGFNISVIELSQQDSSTWAGRYHIEVDDPIGIWYLTAYVEADGGWLRSSPKMVVVTRANLRTYALLNVSQQGLRRFQTLKVTSIVTYPNGTLLREGNVTTEIFVMENEDYELYANFSLQFHELSEAWIGYYSVEPNDPLGNWTIAVRSWDPYGNDGHFISNPFLVNPAKLSLELIDLEDYDYERLETISIKARVYWPNGTLLTDQLCSLALVTSTSLEGDFSWDENLQLWTFEYTFAVDDPLGTWNFTLLATDSYENSGATSFLVEVEPTVLNVTLASAIEPNYTKLDIVNLAFNITYKNGLPIPPTSEVTVSVFGTVYQATYEGGLWKVSVQVPMNINSGYVLVMLEALDPYGNTGSGEATFLVVGAEVEVSLTLNVTSVYRGQAILVLAEVTYRGQIITEGTLLAYLSQGSEVNVTFVGNFTYDPQLGAWKLVYVVPMDMPLGDWNIEAFFEDPYDDYGAGCATLSVSACTKLPVDVWTNYDLLWYGMRLTVIVNFTWPNGTPVTQGAVLVTLLHEGEFQGSLYLIYDPIGEVWKGSVDVRSTFPKGTLVIDVSVEDLYGNTGKGQYSVVIDPEMRAEIEVEKYEYERTELMNVTVYLYYADGVTVVAPTYQPTVLIQLYFVNGTMIDEVELSYNHLARCWVASYPIPYWAPTGTYYVKLVASDSYDNGVELTAPFELEVTTTTITVKAALLRGVALRGHALTIRVYGLYRTLEVVERGTATALIILPNGVERSITLSFEDGLWEGAYTISITDPVGTYQVIVRIADPYYNRGELSATVIVIDAEATVSPEVAPQGSSFSIALSIVGRSPDAVLLEVFSPSNETLFSGEPTWNGTHWLYEVPPEKTGEVGQYLVVITLYYGANELSLKLTFTTESKVYFFAPYIALQIVLLLAAVFIWFKREYVVPAVRAHPWILIAIIIVIIAVIAASLLFKPPKPPPYPYP